MTIVICQKMAGAKCFARTISDKFPNTNNKRKPSHEYVTIHPKCMHTNMVITYKHKHGLQSLSGIPIYMWSSSVTPLLFPLRQPAKWPKWMCLWTSIGIQKKEQTQNKETKSKHEKQHQYGTNASANKHQREHPYSYPYPSDITTNAGLSGRIPAFIRDPTWSQYDDGWHRYRSRDNTQSRERVLLCGDRSESIFGNIPGSPVDWPDLSAQQHRSGGGITNNIWTSSTRTNTTQHNDVAIVAIVKLMTMTNLGRYISKKPPHGSTLFLLFHNRVGIAMALCWKNHWNPM